MGPNLISVQRGTLRPLGALPEGTTYLLFIAYVHSTNISEHLRSARLSKGKELLVFAYRENREAGGRHSPKEVLVKSNTLVGFL